MTASILLGGRELVRPQYRHFNVEGNLLSEDALVPKVLLGYLTLDIKYTAFFLKSRNIIRPYEYKL